MSRRARDESVRKRLWGALDLSDIDQLDHFTKDSLLNLSGGSSDTAYLYAADLRERIGRLASHSPDSITCLEWRKRCLDVIRTAQVQLSDPRISSPEDSLRLLRCIRACFVAAAPLIESIEEFAR